MPRYPHPLVAAAVVALAIGGLTTQPAVAYPPVVNWVLFEVTALTAHEGFDYEYSGRHQPDHDHPWAYLRAVARPGVTATVAAGEFDSFPHAPAVPRQVVVTVTGPAAVDQRVYGDPIVAYGSSTGGSGSFRDAARPLAPAESVFVLLALPMSRFTEWPVLTVSPAEAYSVSMVAHGGDAGYAAARGNGTEGVSAGVNGVGPVAVAANVALRKGAVSAVAVSNCAAADCRWTSRAPDGAPGSWTGTGTPTTNGRRVGVSGGGAVAGPPGTWRWRADAAAYDGKMIAAYVPVGDYWTAFRTPAR